MKTICLHGPESTGKSTMATLLAAGAARSGNLDVSVGIDETATEIRLTRWLRHRSIPAWARPISRG